MDNVSTFVMAGGIGARLFPLTKERSKPAVSFGGRFRLIDFTLSNCLHSGVSRASVLVQYKSASLVEHIAKTWNVPSSCPALSIEVLQPHTGDFVGWYRGTADSIYQNAWVFERDRPRDVLVLAGDHVYHMDYRPFLAWHRRSGAAATIAAVRRPRGDCRELGVLQRDGAGRVTSFLEKPSPDDARLGAAEDLDASMGIYLFRADVLARALAEGPARNRDFDFGADIIPRLVREVPVQSFLFDRSADGRAAYWRDVGTIDAYFDAHMDLLRAVPSIDVTQRRWPMAAASAPRFPVRTVCGENASVERSMVGSGCLIDGSVRHSVLFPGVEIGDGAVIEDAVLLPGARIGSHCVVNNAIVDEGAGLAPGMTLGCGDACEGVYTSSRGVAVLAKGPDAGASFSRADVAHALRA